VVTRLYATTQTQRHSKEELGVKCRADALHDAVDADLTVNRCGSVLLEHNDSGDKKQHGDDETFGHALIQWQEFGWNAADLGRLGSARGQKRERTEE
jgi:hypothetical protein